MKAKTINIHVEGPGELRFISLFLNHHFNLSFSLVKKGGINMVCKDEQKGLTIKLQTYDPKKEQGGINGQTIRKLMKSFKDTISQKQHEILIIDADTEDHRKPPGGYTQRKQYLENLKLEFGIDFDFFIVPDNSSPGNLEDLLDKIVSTKGQPFYECLKNYTDCISNLEKTYYPLDVIDKDLNKIRFEWYPFMMLGRSRGKETGLSKRDYTNGLWNLDAESLAPLLNFFKTHLSV